VRNRSVVELMVLTFTVVVALSIMAMGGLVAVVEIRDPEADTDAVVQVLFSLISATLGALLGLVAGKANGGSTSNELHLRPEDGQPTNLYDDAAELHRRPPPKELPK
jgi:hypothetical protein